MLTRLIYAVLVWVAIAIICIIIGSLLAATGFNGIAVLGSLLVDYAWMIGLLAGLLHFLRGR